MDLSAVSPAWSKIAGLVVLVAACVACGPAPTPTSAPPLPTAIPATAAPVPSRLNQIATGTPAAAVGPCEFMAIKAVTAYARPSAQASIFGQIAPGERLRVGGMTADGWLGFDPAVAQAANVGPFRLRWVQKNDALVLQGACDASHVPIVANLPPNACFEMFMEETKVFSAANKSSAVIVTAKPGDYAQVVAANNQWLQLDLSVASIKQAKTGWIDRSAANFNGPCDRLPAAK